MREGVCPPPTSKPLEALGQDCSTAGSPTKLSAHVDVFAFDTWPTSRRQCRARGTRVDALGDDGVTPRGRACPFGGVAASPTGRRGGPRRPRRDAQTDISRPRFRVEPMGRDAVVQAFPGLRPRGSLCLVLRGRAGRACRDHRPSLVRGARVPSPALSPWPRPACWHPPGEETRKRETFADRSPPSAPLRHFPVASRETRDV